MSHPTQISRYHGRDILEVCPFANKLKEYDSVLITSESIFKYILF